MAQVSAAPKKQRYVPAFTVEKLEGSTTRRKARMVAREGHDGSVIKDKNGNSKYALHYEDVPLPLGWLVRFPKGHSIHIADYEALKAMGFTETEVPLIDLGEGEEVGSVPNQIRRAKTKEVTANA
jgi:hypothetical protein